VNTDNCTIDGGEFQIDLTKIVLHLNKSPKNLGDGAVEGQGVKALINGIPVTKFLGQITPRGTGFENPEDSIDISSLVFGRSSDGRINDQILQNCPLGVAKRVTMNQILTIV